MGISPDAVPHGYCTRPASLALLLAILLASLRVSNLAADRRPGLQRFDVNVKRLCAEPNGRSNEGEMDTT